MSRNRYLGVDIGGTSIKWTLLGDGIPEATGQVATPRFDEQTVLRAVAQIVEVVGGELEGIGVAVPGTVDSVLRRSLFVPNLPGNWTGLDVADVLETLTGIPVALLNDARAFAWAEHTSGAAQGADNALFVTLGTGVGGAIAFRGEVLVGGIDAIGEMGHVPVDARGYLCACGGRGCLETVASGTAIVNHVSRTVVLDQSPVLKKLTSGGAAALTPKIVAEAAQLGDPWARDAFERAADALAHAAATISLLLQLDLVVIGGGLRPASDLYLPRIQSTLDARASLTGAVRATGAHYGPEAGSVGAATFAAARFPSTHSSAVPERTTS